MSVHSGLRDMGRDSNPLDLLSARANEQLINVNYVQIQAGLLLPAPCAFTTLIAPAISELMSAILDGTIRVLPVLARPEKASTYFSATLRFTAWMPPGISMAWATRAMASALAAAIALIASASPCATLMAACFSPSDCWIAALRSPVAMLICSCMRPSDDAIRARL